MPICYDFVNQRLKQLSFKAYHVTDFQLRVSGRRKETVKSSYGVHLNFATNFVICCLNVKVEIR